MQEKTLASEQIYRGKVVSLRLDTVELPSGEKARREIVEHGECVAIIALDSAGNVLLVRQFRKPAEMVLLEIPAGGLQPGEDPIDCVRRELQEETGFTADKLERLGGFYSSPGYCTEFIHLYLASELRPSRLEADSDEAIELVRVPLRDIAGLIASGEIRDAKSICGLLLILGQYRTS